jgi:hypothetical protein
MNSLLRTGWPFLLAGVVTMISFGSWWFFAPRPTQAGAASQAPQRTNSDDSAASPAPKHSTVYDPDPEHLWNRLHDTFRARIEGKEIDPWELDPFLWRSEDYLVSEKGHKAALEVLDEFIAKKGHTLIKDPRKRALLQRDLWALFDSLPVPRWGASQKHPQMKLATRLARIIPRLSLTADEIKKLPDNYAEAVAAKEAWFLPADLWKPKGPWVLLGDDNQMPLALSHIHFFGGRSTFFVFLRMPDGRAQTEKYLAALRKLAPGAAPDAFPPGTDAILMRQMQLIDDQGKPVTTNVTESLQLREGTFELKLNRRAFLAGKPSLKAIGEDDRERDLLLFFGYNAGQGPSNVLKTCSSCHGGMKDILSLNSYRRFRPLYLTPTAKPDLLPSTREQEEARCRGWKANRYEWGLLQGLKQSGPID